MNNYIYLKTLRVADHSVFCVQDGQKFYYDPQFGTRMAFSSGQQVKRCIINEILGELNEEEAPITFNYEIEKNKTLKNKEPWSPCDPNYTDQLLGGWMRAQKDQRTLKRRSAFSFSAMRPLHPLLGGLENQKENISFDRSANPDHHPIRVRDEKGEELNEEQINEFLTTNNRTLARRDWIPDNTRASGLFVNDVAIDLRTLFCVSLNQHEPELDTDTIEKLKAAGWTEGKNVFGSCLICPKERRDKLIPAIAKGLLEWRITSNQARTFSLMETLAIAISDNANKVAGAIRARLLEETERPAAEPIIDDTAGAELFITLPCSGRIRGMEGTADALEKAEQKIIDMLKAFDYDNQSGQQE